MAPARPAGGAPRAPLYLQGPEGLEGPWDEAGERLEDTGRAVVCTTWGQWLTAVLLDPGLRPLLGEDWPRFRGTPSAAGRLRFAVSRYVMKYAAATALDVPVHTVELGRGPGGRLLVRGPGAGVEIALAHTGELIVVGVSRTGRIAVHAHPADLDLRSPLLRGRVPARESAVLDALPEDERRTRLLRLLTLRTARTGAAHDGPVQDGQVQDGQVRDGAVFAPEEFAPEAAGEWSFAAHLVQDRYLVGEAHGPRR
ncbi:hypothetical protein OG373_40275 [Streptomyces avidinii]|uniref:hypothetical protein n=1 Tax=Streptomyces avidinii TaxID=1895 RepID=UPI00386E9DED|nr:hypothetical protein OG373_00890 [Streptomyces avidinii]WTB02101.1 hypothetical protein OG373_40275 [Streptomyces avidinii]